MLTEVPLDVTIQVSPDAGTICAGETVQLLVANPDPGTTYEWSTGELATSISVSPTMTTTYTLTATRGSCVATNDVTIDVTETAETALTISTGSPATICEGEQTSISLDFSNIAATSTVDYTIEDSAGGTISENGVPSNGGEYPITVQPTTTTTYTLTSLTVDGCAAQITNASVEVTVLPLPTVDIVGPDETCPGASVTLTATGADTYIWDTGETTAAITFVADATTTISVEGTTAGCSSMADFFLMVNPVSATILSTTENLCEGQSVELEAISDFSTPDYEWSTGEIGVDRITISPSVSTLYRVTITDGDCEAIDDLVIEVTERPSVAIDAPPTACDGESVTLSASTSALAPTYDWSTGGTDETITDVPSGPTLYSVTITEGVCEVSAERFVDVLPNPELELGPDLIICADESVELLNTFGTIGDYQWSTGEFTDTITVSPVSAELFSVTLSDGNCTSIDDIFVDVTEIQLSVSPDETICGGESVDLFVNGADNYLWDNGQTGSLITVSPATTTTYLVTGFVGNCEADAEVTVFVVDNPEVEASEDVSICSGTSTVLTAFGTGPFFWSTGETSDTIAVSPAASTTYTVSVGSGACSTSDEVSVSVQTLPVVDLGEDLTFCAAAATTLSVAAAANADILWSTSDTTASISVNPATATTYAVTVTENGCAATDSVVVTPFSPSLSVAEVPAICAGESVSLSASGSDNYQWSTGQSGPVISVSPSTTTTYTVSTTQQDCQATAEVTVDVVAAPQVTASADATICSGETLLLSATGTGPFFWSTGETSDTIAVSPAASTTYTVSVGSETCESTDEVVVWVQPLPVVELGEDLALCSGTKATLRVVANPEATIAWSTNENSSSIAISPTVSTQYGVTITENGCAASDSVEVTVNRLPVISAQEPDCAQDGLTYTLVGSITEGLAPYTLNGSVLANTTWSLTGLAADTDNLISVVDANGCQTELLSNFSCACPEVTLSAIPSFCEGSMELLSLNELLNADAPPGSWLIRDSDGLELTNLIVGNSLQSGVLSADTYDLVYELDAAPAQCETIFTLSLQVVAPPQGGRVIDPPLACAGVPVSLNLANALDGVTSGGQWTLLTPSTELALDANSGQVEATALAAGQYNFAYTVSGEANCPDAQTIVTLTTQAPSLEVETQAINCTDPCSGAVLARSNDPLVLFALNGASFSSEANFVGLCAGTYELRVEDAAGCQASTMLELTAPPALEIVVPEELGIRLGDSVLVRAVLSDSTAVLRWEPAAAVRCIDASCREVWVTPSSTVNVLVSASNPQGCSTEARMRVIVDPRVAVYVPTAFSPNGDGNNDLFQVFVGQEVQAIRNFQIFSRWGAQVFALAQWDTNSPPPGWDGSFQGKPLNAGVFVYQFEAELSDGRTEFFKGEILLMR
ncbi:MAG: hypothetical protein D6772_11805 [Bacteroidetes bacterium]|nr:MAG: hypothetical protein D6772_11805 [Bacteroidota bacterium]